jgi:hypothetical protein
MKKTVFIFIITYLMSINMNAQLSGVLKTTAKKVAKTAGKASDDVIKKSKSVPKPKPKSAKTPHEFINKTHLNKTYHSQRAEILLKEFGYEGKIDELFGSNAIIRSTTKGATVELMASKSVTAVKKILKKHYNELKNSSEICLSTNGGKLSLAIESKGYSLTLVSTEAIEVCASKNGKSYSASTKKEEGNTKNLLGTICVGRRRISAEVSSNDVGDPLINLNFLSISGGGTNEDIPLN